ncbi:ribonuclease H-like domain-containing protein, partial [Mycena galericulata]
MVRSCPALAEPDGASPARGAHPGLPYLREKLREAEESQEYLDVLLRETLDTKKSPEQRRASFYGPAYDASSNALEVYTDGSCFENGTPAARAGAGIYFGHGSRYNTSLRVTGAQTNNRGELLAILYVLSSVPRHRALKIYSDSEYSIRSIVYWAPGHAEKGWKCANADLLQDIVSWIKLRSAAVHFVHVKAHSGNAHNDGADSAAKAGAD